MTDGEIAIVLHAHLPYVRSRKPGSLEEDWFFQALMECYLPLLDVLEKSLATKDQNPKITIGLSPTLLSLLDDPELKERFPLWLALRLDLLDTVTSELRNAAKHLKKRINTQLKNWNSINGDLINRFTALQNAAVIDILTCAATHGYLPLLRENPEVINGQLQTAVKEHTRLFGIKPKGIWLPECAYYEGLDSLLRDSGLKYAVLDGHGLLNADPRPRYGIYAPICTKQGVAFFGRDSESTLPVWSAKDGYPGHKLYREFHRDLGWDLDIDKLKSIGIGEHRPLGLKLFKVTNQNSKLNEKEPYEPYKAELQVKEHAKSFLQERRFQLTKLNQQMSIRPLLVAPFDAELFGHWWFEGPSFLSELFKQAPKEKIKFVRLKDSLIGNPKIQLCSPSPSSWGQGGYHDYWLNEANSWIVPEWSKAGKAMVKECTSDQSRIKSNRLLKQAARELLLAQSSDWSFILRAGTTTDLAKNRINLHLKNFWDLINKINKDDLSEENLLSELELENRLFPLIDIKDWKKNN